MHTYVCVCVRLLIHTNATVTYYVCVYVCSYVNVLLCVCVGVFVYTCFTVFVCRYAHLLCDVHVILRIYTYFTVYIYIYIYIIYMYICLCVHNLLCVHRRVRSHTCYLVIVRLCLWCYVHNGCISRAFRNTKNSRMCLDVRGTDLHSIFLDADFIRFYLFCFHGNRYCELPFTCDSRLMYDTSRLIVKLRFRQYAPAYSGYCSVPLFFN